MNKKLNNSNRKKINTPSNKNLPFVKRKLPERNHSGINWQPKSSIFSEISAEAAALMQEFPSFLEKVWPLKKRHKENLPQDIASLSRSLTSNRSELEKNYWSRPENVSAYLYYFLPWNLVRLIRYLTLPELSKPVPYGNLLPVLFDAGSGPLTFPIALWLARPDWRDLPLQIFALDKVERPMQLGKKIFEELAKRTGHRPWKVEFVAGSLYSLPALANDYLKIHQKYIWLISAVNVLNELACKTRRDFGKSFIDECEMPDFDSESEEKYFSLLSGWAPLWGNSPEKSKILFVEPGTRAGGSSIMLLRKAAAFLRLRSISPCVHNESCPLLKLSDTGADAYQKRWCHFTFSADAPVWLGELSRASGLPKRFLSLSPLLLEADLSQDKSRDMALVLSRGFNVPGKTGKCCYACHSSGLLLIENCGELSTGRKLNISINGKMERDRKSGANCIR